MNIVYITIAVEDPLSEAVVRRMLQQSDKNYCVGNCLMRSGFGYLKSKINEFNKASRKTPFFVLTDQDIGCPPEKINSRFNDSPNSNLIFRIAVMEIESWVMADRKAIADFLSISVDNFPYKMDEISNPKNFLLTKAKKSRKRKLKNDIIPVLGSTAKQGPDYNARLSEFIRKNWDVNRAIKYSESLNRAFNRLQEYNPILK